MRGHHMDPRPFPHWGVSAGQAVGVKSHSMHASQCEGSRPAYPSRCMTQPSTMRPSQPVYVAVGAPGHTRPTKESQAPGQICWPSQVPSAAQAP